MASKQKFITNYKIQFLVRILRAKKLVHVYQWSVMFETEVGQVLIMPRAQIFPDRPKYRRRQSFDSKR